MLAALSKAVTVVSKVGAKKAVKIGARKVARSASKKITKESLMKSAKKKIKSKIKDKFLERKDDKRKRITNIMDQDGGGSGGGGRGRKSLGGQDDSFEDFDKRKLLAPTIDRTSKQSGSNNTISDKSVENLSIIASTLMDVDTVMKGSLALDEIRGKKQRKAKEKKERSMKERMRESITGAGKAVGGKVKKKVSGAVANPLDWINQLVFSVILVGLWELKPVLLPILKFLMGFSEIFLKVVGWLFNIASTLIHWTYMAYDGLRGMVGNVFGEGGLKVFDNLMSVLNNFINLAIMGVMSLLSFKWLRNFAKGMVKRIGNLIMKIPGVKNVVRSVTVGAKRLIGRGGRQFFKKVSQQGLRKTLMQSGKQGVKKATGMVVKWFGPKIANVVQPLFKNIMKTPAAGALRKIPVLGPIIVGVFSILAGDPLGKTLFKVLGAALGGMLGTAAGTAITGALATATLGIGAVLVPLIVPACTILGEMIGVWIGDLLYNLFFGGGLGKLAKSLTNGLKEAFKKILDIPKWIANFVTSGVRNFIEDFPTLPIPDISPGDILASIIEKVPGGKRLLDFTIPGWIPFIGGKGIGSILEGLPGLQEVLGFFAQAVPGLNSYVEGGKLEKIPNLLLLAAPPLLIPHFMKSFFGGDKKGESPGTSGGTSGGSTEMNDDFFTGEGETDFDEFDRVSDYATVNGKRPGEEGYKKHTLSDKTKDAFQKDNLHLQSIDKFMKLPIDFSRESSISKESDAEDKSGSLSSYPSYDARSPQTAMIPMPPQVKASSSGGEDDSGGFVGSSGGGQDPFETFYAHSGGVV